MEDVKLVSHSYHDFSGLGELRARAQKHDPQAVKEVGQKFEALFIQMILKSAREATATMKSGLMGSSAQDTFEEMYHRELSQEIAKRGVFGVAEWLTEQIQRQGSSAKAINTYEQSSAMPLAAGEEQKKFMPLSQDQRSMKLNTDTESKKSMLVTQSQASSRKAM